LTHPNSKHSSDRVLRQNLVLEEYSVDINHISGDKNITVDALSRLPTKELFIMGDSSFPLNLELIADKQAEDQHLQTQVLCEQPKYKQSVRDNVTIYTYPATQAVYVPVSLRGAVLQWYHMSLQHPGIRGQTLSSMGESFFSLYQVCKYVLTSWYCNSVIHSFIHSEILSHGVLFLLVSSGITADVVADGTHTP
jgi:hypothetical protein